MNKEIKALKFVKDDFIPRLTDNEYKQMFNAMLEKHPDLKVEFLDTCLSIVEIEAMKPIPNDLFEFEKESDTYDGKYKDVDLTRVERYLDGIEFLKMIGKSVMALQRLTGALKYAKFEQSDPINDSTAHARYLRDFETLVIVVNRFDDEIVEVAKMIDPKSMKPREYNILISSTVKEVDQTMDNLSTFNPIILRKTRVLMKAITDDLNKNGKVRDGLVGYVNGVKGTVPRKKLSQYRTPKRTSW